MSFQDVARRKIQKEQELSTEPSYRRKVSPQRIRITVHDSMGSSSPTMVVSRRDTEPKRPLKMSDLSSVRYLHDDLLNKFRLNLSQSHSQSSFLESSTTESRDDIESYGEDRVANDPDRDSVLPDRRVATKSTFAEMSYQTQLFQKTVTELEVLLKKTGDSPKSNWKASILVKSAQDTDVSLSNRLYAYERSLLLQNPSGLRISQKTACLKLQRDFQRSHSSLISCLNEYDRRQRAEVSQLASKQWSRSVSDGKAKTNDDFFERTMRQRELERMNKSMRQVNDIYNDLAELVDGQQDHIDQVERDIEYAAENTEAGADEIHCLHGKRGGLMCGVLEGCAEGEDNISVTHHSNSSPKSPNGLRVSEVFHWYMPFETIKEDLESVKRDIVLIGKDIISSGKHFECASSKSF